MAVVFESYSRLYAYLRRWGYTSYRLIMGWKSANYLQKVSGAVWKEADLVKAWGDIFRPGKSLLSLHAVMIIDIAAEVFDGAV